jgi:hypothetical protein
VTDFRLWDTATVGPAASAVDAAVNVATEFRISAAGGNRWLKGISFWRPDAAMDGAIQVHARTITAPGAGTLVAGSVATPALGAPGQWTEHLYDPPIPLVNGANYQAVIHAPSGYAATGDYWSTGDGGGGLADGPLSAPNYATSGSRQGSFFYDAAPQYPANGSASATNFWVQPIVTDIDPADMRSGEITIPVTVDTDHDGEKAAAGAVEAALSIGAAGAGEMAASAALDIPISVVLSVAGTSISVSTPVSQVLCTAWAIPADIPAAIRAELDLTDTQLAGHLMLASEILWALSGRRWYGGGCTEEAVLRSSPPLPGTQSWPYHASWGSCGCWAHGTWLDGRFFPPRDYRHQQAPMAIRLPRAPVTSVLSVTVGGEPFAAYNLIRQGWVERIDGQGWNTCDGETVVRYTFGEPPPLGGREAVIKLAVEFARASLGQACRLPQRTTSVVRQGISIEMTDPMEFFEHGRTGLFEVDLWLSAVNPQGRPQSAGVWSPDIPTALRRAT